MDLVGPGQSPGKGSVSLASVGHSPTAPLVGVASVGHSPTAPLVGVASIPTSIPKGVGLAPSALAGSGARVLPSTPGPTEVHGGPPSPQRGWRALPNPSPQRGWRALPYQNQPNQVPALGAEKRGDQKKEKLIHTEIVGKNQEEVNLERPALSMDFSTNFQNSLQKRLQTKIVELAKHYNEESIEAVTNFFADILSFATLWFLLVRLEIQINITKSFLLEVFFGLDDSKKSLLILFLTDLLVGYHSPNIWELFFQTLFDHYGLPESQTTIFLLVATLPVLLDVLFKYLIFRHLNRASPATVATYHAMIE